MNRILISRTDSIGDVVLTLPVAAALKRSFPGCTVVFLGSEYTRPVAERCRYVDEFVAWTKDEVRGTKYEVRSTKYEGVELLRGLRVDAVVHAFPEREVCRAAKIAGIPVRVATAGRFFTWNTCNRRVWVPRKHSNLHEAQLNLALLKGLGAAWEYGTDEIGGMYGMEKKSGQADKRTSGKGEEWTSGQADGRAGGKVSRHAGGRRRVILHPKSKGSAREWGLDNFSRLITLLPEHDFEVVVTGTGEEGALMRDFLELHRGRITDLTGKLTLSGLMDLIAASDALVAASTGPLHLAAALGIKAVGLYAPMRPIFPTRWAPIGKNARFLVLEKKCSDCRHGGECQCIKNIQPEEVAEIILSRPKTKGVA